MLFAAAMLAVAPRSFAEDPISPEQADFFENKVRPVLAEHCYSCHGPERQKMELRVDSRAALLTGSETGTALVPGDPVQSKLLQVLRHEGAIKMPPKGKLEDAQIQAIEDWIAMGAPWPGGGAAIEAKRPMAERIAEARATHWAFQPVRKPETPAPGDTGWAKNPIDHLVQAQLAAKGLEPSPAAPDKTLVRRANFDLTGLPPTAEQLEQFAANPSQEAYAQQVDELLASPRYGERWARYWLDIARYSDTKGYVFQQERAFPYSYTYRDYVIRAFNEDLPYDEFIRHQLAADMMDLGADKRPLAALGMLTLGRQFIGNIHDITDDRIDVVTRGFLGMTVSCARCHEHKFDPISAEDYYAFYGIFRSIQEPAEPPLIEEPDPNDPQYQEFTVAVAEKQKELDDYILQRHVELLAHAREKTADYLLAAHDVGEETGEPLQALARDRNLRWQLVQTWRDWLKARAALENPDPVLAPWFRFAALPAEGFDTAAPALAKEVAEGKGGPVNARVAEAFKDAAPTTMAEVAEVYRRVLQRAERAWTDWFAAQTQITQKTGSGPALPLALQDGALEQVRQLLFGADTPANVPVGDLQTLGDVPLRDNITNRRNALARVKATHPGRPDCAQSVVDVANPFDPYVFIRGKADMKGPQVPRRFLEVLTAAEPAPFTQGSGRLELANAIASRENPLTARVMANRVWMYLMGTPLVDTPSDFGVRSNPPANPELLDYLAWYLMEHNWSIKALQRHILLSATYQQDSADRADARAIDPENTAYWRQNRKRLDFEAMRDALLFASGRLDMAMGGPSVEITEPPYTPRRSVYSFIERQNLPGMFRTFDFASPDTHSPRRFQTTVPQQALFMMNSPFVVEQARALAQAPEVAGADDTAARVAAMYRRALHRNPDQDEIALASRYLDGATEDPAESSGWLHGYGGVDPLTGQVSFTALPVFGNDRWKGGDVVPDAELGWCNLTAGGGHPGKGPDRMVIRRWTAPYDGVVETDGTLGHDAECGDGVHGWIVASDGIHWTAPVAREKVATRATGIFVRQGETLDFILGSLGDENCDSFTWAPVVRYVDTPFSLEGARTEWNGATDFRGPQPAPLKPLEQYAQVLLLTNEFVFVD